MRFVLLSEDVCHKWSFIDSSDTEVQVQPSIWLNDSFNHVWVLESKTVKWNFRVEVIWGWFQASKTEFARSVG